MKSKKGIDIVTSVGTRLYDEFINASTTGTKRVVTTVGTGAGQNQMAMQNDTTIVDTISASGRKGLPTEKAVADAMCKTFWTGNLSLRGRSSNTIFFVIAPVLLSKEYYIVLHFIGELASSSSSTSSSSIDFAAILKPSARSDYSDATTTVSVTQRMSPSIVLNANIVITFGSNYLYVYPSAVSNLPYVKSLSLIRIDMLAKII